MKISISHEFDNIEDAVAFLTGHAQPIVMIDETKLDPATFDAQPGVPKTRKPRSDAGKPRGKYKTQGPRGPQVEPSAAPAADGQASATPSGAALTDNALASGETGSPAAAEPTLDDVKAALLPVGRKHGIEANFKLLGEFGVNQLSKLPAEKYGEFIKAAKALV